MSWAARAREGAEAVRRHTDRAPEVAVILGSGLGALAEAIEADVAIPYAEIPHFPRPGVEGHAGRLVIGSLEGRGVVAMQGRTHFYEGYAMAEVVYPVRLMRALGAGLLVVTNAAGGLNRNWRAGDLMVICDHINFMGTNPLIGPNEEELGPRFPDMSSPYDPDLIEAAERAALAEAITLRKGVYIGVSGPSYETPAELRMMARWGADAVGMSTAHEVIAARHVGMRVLGLTAIADMATGEAQAPVTHEEVIAVTKRIEPAFVRLVRRILATLPG